MSRRELSFLQSCIATGNSSIHGHGERGLLHRPNCGMAILPHDLLPLNKTLKNFASAEDRVQAFDGLHDLFVRHQHFCGFDLGQNELCAPLSLSTVATGLVVLARSSAFHHFQGVPYGSKVRIVRLLRVYQIVVRLLVLLRIDLCRSIVIVQLANERTSDDAHHGI